MNKKTDPKFKNRLPLIWLVGAISLLSILVVVLLAITISKTTTPKAPTQEDSIPVSLSVGDEQKDDEKKEAETTTEEPDPQPKEETTPEPQPIESGNGLSFAKNGDGTCRLVGLGSCTDVCVIIPETSPEGDLVTEIAADAFLGKSGIAAIQIPSTVQFIGERAFADCRDLLYLSVSEKNRYFCDVDGVLYSKDKRVLLQYPTLSASGSVKLPIEVKEIREMAFYNCPYLAKIYYVGGPEDWEAISIGTKNYALLSAVKQFYADRGGK